MLSPFYCTIPNNRFDPSSRCIRYQKRSIVVVFDNPSRIHGARYSTFVTHVVERQSVVVVVYVMILLPQLLLLILLLHPMVTTDGFYIPYDNHYHYQQQQYIHYHPIRYQYQYQNHDYPHRILARRPTASWRSEWQKSSSSLSSSTSPKSSNITTTHNTYLQNNQYSQQPSNNTDLINSSSSLSLKSFTTTTQFVDPSILPESSINVNNNNHKNSTNPKSKHHHLHRKPRRTQQQQQSRTRCSVVSSQQQQQQQEEEQEQELQQQDVHDEVDVKNEEITVVSSQQEVSSLMMDLQTMATGHPSKAHEILNRLQLEYGDAVPPQDIVTCYATVMDGYIQAGKRHEAQHILEELEHTRLSSVLAVSSTSTTTSTLDQMYISMTQAWAEDYKDDYSGSSAENAELILRRVMLAAIDVVPVNENPINVRRVSSESNKTSASSSDLVFPVNISANAIVKMWTIVVDGWSKRAGIIQRAMIRADDLLHEMETHQVPFIRPNVLTYTSVICGLSRCKQNDMARRAEDILERMKQNHVLPDMVAYAAVINCWAKAVSRRERGIAAKRAIGLLNEMERLYITKKVYNVKPSTLTYITVITAIGNCIDPDSTQLAESILQRMRNLHESGTIVNVKPNTAAYNAVIFALGRGPISKRNPTALRAEKLLDEMTQRAALGEWDVQPDVRTWAFVLRAWTRSKQPDAAEQAQRVLDKMENLYENGLSPVRPNFVCYTTVMGAWGYSRSNHALDNMERILKRMEDQYTNTLEPDVRPNTVSYVTVSSEMSRSCECRWFIHSHGNNRFSCSCIAVY